jgi:hypothetical protein
MRRRLIRGTAGLAATLALAATAFWMTPVGAQEVDPALEAQWDTAEMTRIMEQVERMPLMDHAALVDRLRAKLDERLLTPDPELTTRWAELRGRTDAGVARLISRGLFDGKTSVRGGGAYFSFVTGSNSYDETPDLELQRGRFSSGFAGGDDGVFALLDVRDVRAVTESDVPASIRGDAHAIYDDKKGHERRPELKDGQIYALRSMHWGEHDTLAAFQVIGTDDLGVTIAWRRLRSYEAKGHPGRRNR